MVEVDHRMCELFCKQVRASVESDRFNARDLDRLTRNPEAQLNASSSVKRYGRATSGLVREISISSAYRLIVCVSAPNLIPVIPVWVLTACASGSMYKVNRVGDSGQPFLVPLPMSKAADVKPFTLTVALGDL